MASINRHGLLPEKATGREKATWLVSRSQIVWAIAHTATKRDKAPITKLVVLRVEVPRSSVRRFRRGIWRSFVPLRPVGCEAASAYTLSYPGAEPDWDWLAAEAEALDALTNGHFLG
jgi:hypothetical protein